MGFYGNITNTARTQFQFDRVYPNRSTMEALTSDDGIYAGRYVLIEYETSRDIYKSVYKDKSSKDFFYTSPNFEEETKLLFGATSGSGVVKKDEIVLVSKGNGAVGDYDELWRATKETGYDNPVWVFVTDVESDYQANYIIDQDWAAKNNVPISRGWDSTVWQKVYMNGREKYVMIAELNTVVPTFDISADAPTMSPITPHFDTNSTNIYYKLHWQPQWGLRVKSANVLSGERLDSAGDPISGTSTDYSANKTIFPSDENTIWARHEYNASTGEEVVYYYDEKNKQWVKTPEGAEVAAAIYYNKAGFDPAKITYSDENLSDTINIAPTGLSGHLYNAHRKNDADKDPREDIQELTVMLPSIGDSVAKMWDIVYGNEEQNNSKDRNLDINWNSTEGLRLVEEEQSGNGFTYSEDKVNTLAGCINSVHDLMGMIIEDVDNEDAILTGSMDKIYYYDNKFYRKKQDYEYEKIEINSEYFDLRKIEFPEGNGYSPNTYYYKNGEVYEPDADQTWDSNKEYYALFLNKNYKEEFYIFEDLRKNTNQYALWNNNVLLVPCTVTLAKRTSDLKFQKEELIGFARTLNTIHGLILKINQMLEMGDAETRDLETVQGVINKVNDIIYKFDSLTPQHFVIVDSHGNIHSSDFDTSQSDTCSIVKTENHEGGLKKGVSGDVFAEVATVEDMEDQWITVNIDANAENPMIKVHHNFQPVNDVGTSYNKNTGIGNGIHAAEDIPRDIIALKTPIVDKMGHVVGTTIEKVTLPYSYKTISTDGISLEEGADLFTTEDGKKPTQALSNTIANSTQDILKINPYNKWIQIGTQEEPGNKLEIAHEIHPISKQESLNVIELDYENNRSIPDTSGVYDAAGHITTEISTKYKLPNAYYNISVENNIGFNDNSVPGLDDVDQVEESYSITAPNEGNFKLINGNKWISLSADSNNNEIKIYHSNHGGILRETGNNTPRTLKLGENFNIPYITADKLGHIRVNAKDNEGNNTGFKDNVLTLPTVSFKNNGAIVNVSLSNNESITDLNYSNINIEAGNRWITFVKATEPEKEGTIYVHHSQPGTGDNYIVGNNPDSSLKFGSTIKIPYLKVDNAGHIAVTTEGGFKDNTLTLPKLSYKNNTGINPASEEINTELTQINSSHISIESGNRWIAMSTESGESGETRLLVSHAAPGEGNLNHVAGNNLPNKILTPGESFWVPYIKADNTGHIAVDNGGLVGRELFLSTKSTPSLSEEQKQQISDLAIKYNNNRKSFIYNGSSLRDTYLSASTAFEEDVNGKLKAKTNCGLLCSLIWGGVKPETFTKYLGETPTTENYQGYLDFEFDWGYEFVYPCKVARNIKNESSSGSGYYGLLSDSLEAGSYNTYYNPNKTDEYKQSFYSFLTCADMANELYLGGYEVPMKDIEVGDLLFFNARNLSDNYDDYNEGFRFRNITHTAIVTSVKDIDEANGIRYKQISFVESTSMAGRDNKGDQYSISLLTYSNNDSDYRKTRRSFLLNHVVMAARHPAAFNKNYKGNFQASDGTGIKFRDLNTEASDDSGA